MKSFMVHATVAGVVLLEEPQPVVVKNVVAVHELKRQCVRIVHCRRISR